MQSFRKIASGLRIQTASDGTSKDYELEARPVGRGAKVALYSIVVIQSSSNAQGGLRLDHGPDGTHFTTHSTPISSTSVPTSKLLSGSSDSSIVLNEYLRPVVVAGSSGATEEWLDVDVYEMLKDF